MDTETSRAFAKVLEYIADSLGQFVKNNGESTTEYVKGLGKEIVAYKLNIAYLWEIVAIIAAIIGIVLLITGIVKSNDTLTFIGIIAIVIAIVTAIINAYTIIECNTFPEKVILDYVNHICNSSGSR